MDFLTYVCLLGWLKAHGLGFLPLPTTAAARAQPVARGGYR